MTDNSANLSLPYIQPSQAQKHVTHNEAIRLLDAVVQLTVLSATETTPPTAQTGQRWILPDGATGEWSTRDHMIAIWQETAWAFITPAKGWLAYDQANDRLLAYDGTKWISAIAGDATFSDGSLTQFGVNTTPDPTNRLAVKTDQALFSHDDITPGSGNMLLVANKDTTGNDTGIALQTAYNTHALLGLLASDDTVLKVSPDGTTYQTAMTVDKDTGNVAFGGDTPSAAGALNAGGALLVSREANAHNTASNYTALVLGAPGDQGGLYAIARLNPANLPFTGLSGWDNGTSRILYFGGGGWSSPDATEHRFYCASSYSETKNTGKRAFSIHDTHAHNETDLLRAATSANNAEMQFRVLEEDITTASGATVDSSIQIPNGAIVFNVSSRVITAISGAASFDVGTATTSDQFGGSLNTTVNSTNMGTIGPTGFYADTAIRLTANSASFTGGTVRIAICYYMPVVPQA